MQPSERKSYIRISVIAKSLDFNFALHQTVTNLATLIAYFFMNSKIKIAIISICEFDPPNQVVTSRAIFYGITFIFSKVPVVDDFRRNIAVLIHMTFYTVCNISLYKHILWARLRQYNIITQHCGTQ